MIVSGISEAKNALGIESSSEVESIGKKMTRIKKGDQVFAHLLHLLKCMFLHAVR
jgi:NADPH:quinone reductase-like Zn-dependent oxidoreductase